MRFPIVLLALLYATSIEGRERIKLDSTWRFLYVSNPPGQCTSKDFPLNFNNISCKFLHQSAAASNANDCMERCCEDSQCAVWQWCPPNATCTPPGTCWYGGTTTYCTSAKPDWVSSGRTVVLPTPSNCTVQQCQVSYNDSSWRQLNVPHDFVVEQTFSATEEESHGYLPRGMGWYRKHYTFPSSWKGQSIWIDFDGVYRNSQVWFNGVSLGIHESGYTSFRYYLYPNSHITINWDADNLISVYADATHDEGWWYEGGGIYRHVWLTHANSLHIIPDFVYVPATVNGTITSTVPQTASSAFVNVSTSLMNDDPTNSVNFVLNTNVLDKTGNVVGKSSSSGSIKPSTNFTLSQIISWSNVALWSVENPALYTIVSSATVNNLEVDQVQTTFGVRKLTFDVNKGFFLNDKSVKIKGACNHQDFAGTGTAVPDRVNEFRVRKLQEMGANAWRMSHNPPNPELLDITDRLGMIVWDENRNFADNAQYYADMRDMVIRDRNHPSVIFWSLCNEAGCMEGESAGQKVGDNFDAVIHQYDKTRPVTAGMRGGWGTGVSLAIDIQGINYHYDEYDTYHTQDPQQPIIGSETASCTCARGIYETNATACHKDVYSADSCAKTWVTDNFQRAFVEGGFAWTGFDYKGEPTPYNWPEVNSNFGSLDIAGFEKDTFYYYQAAYLSTPVLHIWPHWNWPTAGQTVTVWAYTNLPSVELFINGATQGKKTVPLNVTDVNAFSASWSVKFASGDLVGKGYDNSGATVLSQTISTTGAASAIHLAVETYAGKNGIIADGQDAAMVAVSIVDAQGRVVPTANNEVTFTVSGAGSIYGVGNGDPASHEPDKGSKRAAFNGLARVIVQSTTTAGVITLTASASGLQSGSISITTSA